MTDAPAGPTLVLDIGGTKIAAGLVDAKGQLLHRNQQPTPRGTDADEVWAAAERTIAEALGAAGGVVSGSCISSAGPIDVTKGTISPVNISAWRGFPVRTTRNPGLFRARQASPRASRLTVPASSRRSPPST